MWPEDYIQRLKKGTVMIDQKTHLECDLPTWTGQKVHLFNTSSLGRSEKKCSDEGLLYATELNYE